MKFPIVVLDQLFTNPDEVRDFALGLEYSSDTPEFPGTRSQELGTVAPFLKEKVIRSLLAQYSESGLVKLEARAYFQKITPSDLRGTDGIAHRDENVITFMGYLTPNVLDCGTSILKPKTDFVVPFNNERKMAFYSGEHDDQFGEYVKEYNDYHYSEICRVSGLYNTGLAFNGFEPHKANLTPVNPEDNVERLTLVMFVYNIHGLSSIDHREKRGSVI